MAKEWNQHLKTKDSAARLQKLKDTTLALYRQLAPKAEEDKGKRTEGEDKDQPLKPETAEKLHMGRKTKGANSPDSNRQGQQRHLER